MGLGLCIEATHFCSLKEDSGLVNLFTFLLGADFLHEMRVQMSVNLGIQNEKCILRYISRTLFSCMF